MGNCKKGRQSLTIHKSGDRGEEGRWEGGQGSVLETCRGGRHEGFVLSRVSFCTITSTSVDRHVSGGTSDIP